MMGDRAGLEITIGVAGLARFMPMHLLLDPEGRVISAGPTLLRVLARELALDEGTIEFSRTLGRGDISKPSCRGSKRSTSRTMLQAKWKS